MCRNRLSPGNFVAYDYTGLFRTDFRGSGDGFPELRVLISKVACPNFWTYESAFPGITGAGFRDYVSGFWENGLHALKFEMCLS